jgi:hypothetical protein
VSFLLDEFVLERRNFFAVVAAKRAIVAATMHTAWAGLDAFVLGLVYLFFLFLVVCTRYQWKRALVPLWQGLCGAAIAMRRLRWRFGRAMNTAIV